MTKIKKLYLREQEREHLIKANKPIKEEAKTDVRDLEEYIRQESFFFFLSERKKSVKQICTSRWR